MAYEFSEQRKDATPSTASLHEAFRGSLPFDDGGDHERATRGLLSPSPERQIIGRFAHAVWDLDAFAFEHDAVAPPHGQSEFVAPSTSQQCGGAL